MSRSDSTKVLRLLLAPAALVCALATTPSLGDEKPAASLDETRVERLAALGRLWGQAKFFHPYLAYGDIDWDQALVDTIPMVEAAETAEEYRQAVEHLLSFLDDPATRVVEEEDDAEEDDGETPEPRFPEVRRLDEGFVVVAANDYQGMAATQKWRGGLFEEAFQVIGDDARGVVLDLRRESPPGDGDSFVVAFVANSLRIDLWPLLAEQVILPAPRRRMYSGYPPQTPQGVSFYYSGFVTQDHEAIAGARETPLPMVVLTSDGTDGLWPVLGGLQSSGAATVIHQGEATGGAPGSDPMSVEMTDGLVVTMRTAELIGADGTVSFAPDLVAEAPAGGGADPALEKALAVLRGEVVPPEAQPLKGRSSGVRYYDRRYPDMSPLPPREYRLLGLFRFWNVIERFYPYKDLLDRPWDEVLPRFIPKLADADDPLAYALAVNEMVAQIQDTHGFVQNPVFSQHVGSSHPSFLAEFVEDELVVTWIPGAPKDGDGGERIAVGDVVTAVDGEAIAERRERLAPYVSASTPQALRWRLGPMMLSGEEETVASLTVVTGDGEPRTVDVARDSNRWQLDRERRESSGEVYRLLPEGYGYADLSRLEPREVKAVFETFRQAAAIILDLRGYPKGTAWTITPWLADESRVAARFRRPTYLCCETDPNLDATWDYRFEQKFPTGGTPWRYEGRLVVLIDARAISQSEHTCLFFESAYRDVTFVGSPTNGANGDVTGLTLPGNMWVSFTGHDVRHADGRQLQRVGIQPDVFVEPTIEGIRAGRDEVLEAAIEFLSHGKPPAREGS